jgi:hypothetical protein
MWHQTVWPALLLSLTVPIRAGGPAETKPAPHNSTTVAEKYRAIDDDYQREQREFRTKNQQAKTAEERRKLVIPQPRKYAERMLRLAGQHSDDPEAIDALCWIVTHVPTGDEAKQALNILDAKHAESSRLAPVCQALSSSSSPGAEKLLRHVLKKNKHHAVQGQACYALGKLLAQQSDLVRRIKDNPGIVENIKRLYGRGYADHLAAADADMLAAEAEKSFQRVVETCHDVASYRGTLADAAKLDLFEIRNLAIGKVAPEIEGGDIDGRKFKLSDYRGRVVVLDFWGHW